VHYTFTQKKYTGQKIKKYIEQHKSDLQLGCHPVAIVQYNTVQYSAVQYNSVQYSAVWCSIVQYNTMQYSIVQNSAVQYNTEQ
jgi:hypothetical protein